MFRWIVETRESGGNNQFFGYSHVDWTLEVDSLDLVSKNLLSEGVKGGNRRMDREGIGSCKLFVRV